MDGDGRRGGQELANLHSVMSIYKNNHNPICQAQLEVEVKSVITAKPKSRKCLGTYLTKNVNDLYPENYKISLREMKEGLNRQRVILYQWIGRLCIFKIDNILRLVYRFNTIKILASFL